MDRPDADERLNAEIEFVASCHGHAVVVLKAATTDLLRAMHEWMVKAGGDQLGLLEQVQLVFGSTTMHHLARLLGARGAEAIRTGTIDAAPLAERVDRICRQRGLEPGDGRQMLAHVIKALDEERTDPDGSTDSAAVMTYWSLGDEAAYHLGSLYLGDEGEMVMTQLCGYLDPTLCRFHKWVEMWTLEEQWRAEAAK